MQPELSAAIDALSRAPILLVATDFDGTIAPIVNNFTQAEASRESLVALKSLAVMAQTRVAIISGRALSDLAVRAREVDEAHLIGSHGSEFETVFASELAPNARTMLERLTDYLKSLVEKAAGLVLESKPAALALHYRTADEGTSQAALDAILRESASWSGVNIRHGKKVIEFSMLEMNKGAALQRMRQRLGASGVLFIGDDVTDEDAFTMLTGPDVGIKVGPGTTAARFRVDGTLEVAQVLASIAERRAAWVAGSHATAIQHHSLLSDQRTVALIDPRARVVWACLPRIDSGAVFADLLGGPTAGFFDISPVSTAATPTQRYEGDTFILETNWPGLRVLDYLDCGGARPFQRAGRTDLVRVIEGRGRVRVAFAPRIDFGRIDTQLSIVEGGIAVEGSVDSLVLRSPGVAWTVVDEGRHQTATAEFDLTDSPVVLELRYGTGSLEPDAADEPQRRARTARFWSGWAATLTPPALAREPVMRSALMLKALVYGPTGAISAAGTTSLPEHFGGVRNWDYRYCWPRDAAMSASALLRLGAPGPAIKLLDWMLGILDATEPGTLLNPLYTVTGRHLGPEGEIAELSGYRGSRPVRVGNAAARQIQLDVFGPVAELIAQLAAGGAALSAEHWRLVESMVLAVERRWREPDHGIWEVRRGRRHHVHSKVMCWQTLDRALAIARYMGRRPNTWEALRAAIAEEVLRCGWNDSKKAYCAAYDDGEADAASLSIGLSGLLPPDDPRFIGTVAYVEAALREGPTVFRYRYDDGLPGTEGGFLLCTSWLIESLWLIGRRDDARALFDEYLSQMGPTGLMAEEFDPATGAAMGNVPQAYSHLGLINTALLLGS